MHCLLQSLLVTLQRMEKLPLRCCALDTQQLQTLLTHFPRLCELKLNDADHFYSLAFLKRVCATLHSFTLESCRGFDLSADTLLLLRSFVHLTSLALDRESDFRLYSGYLDDALAQALTPPSTLLPNLREFRYIPPLQMKRFG